MFTVTLRTEQQQIENIDAAFGVFEWHALMNQQELTEKKTVLDMMNIWACAGHC